MTAASDSLPLRQRWAQVECVFMQYIDRGVFLGERAQVDKGCLLHDLLHGQRTAHVANRLHDSQHVTTDAASFAESVCVSSAALHARRCSRILPPYRSAAASAASLRRRVLAAQHLRVDTLCHRLAELTLRLGVGVATRLLPLRARAAALPLAATRLGRALHARQARNGLPPALPRMRLLRVHALSTCPQTAMMRCL